MLDPYVYSGTNILRNVLGIQDRQTLDDAEADYVSLRLRELAENPLEGRYDVAHLTKMHRYIFQDIYEWAGKIRTINIEKEEPALGGLSIEYSDKTKIENDLSKALEKMVPRPWADLSLDDRVKYFSEDLAAVWKVHGFREGNTRLAVTFCCQFIEAQGIPIDRTIFEKHSAYVRTALVAYSAVSIPRLGGFIQERIPREDNLGFYKKWPIIWQGIILRETFRYVWNISISIKGLRDSAGL